MATPKRGAPIHRICSSIAVLQAIGIREPCHREVARLAGYSGGIDVKFEEDLDLAIKQGFVRCRPCNNNLRLTIAGKNCVTKVLPAKDNAEMLARLHLVLCKKKAPEMALTVLEILSDGKTHMLASVAAQIDSSPNFHRSVGFKKAVSAIRSLKVLGRPVKGVDGSIVLRDVALPSGRNGRRVRISLSPAPKSGHDKRENDHGQDEHTVAETTSTETTEVPASRSSTPPAGDTPSRLISPDSMSDGLRQDFPPTRKAMIFGNATETF